MGDDFAALRPCGLTLYADALMRVQAAAGHEVSYVFAGRHYPKLSGPRLKRWRKGGVRMFELVGAPNNRHWERGTRYPARDLDEPAGEAAFAAAVREADPQVVHIQEFGRLPSSLIEAARERGVPVVMTLHDYSPVCAAVKLLDADGRRCTRHDVGDDCARNCAGAPTGHTHLIDRTLGYEMSRIKEALPLASRVDFASLGPAVGAAKRLVSGKPGSSSPAAQPVSPGPVAAPADYQRRRDVNVRRLNLCDRLVAPSERVAEMYASLGVDRDRLTVQRLTVPHLEGLRARSSVEVHDPLRFVTLGSCASPAKGSRIVIDAVEALERAGRGSDYRLTVHGHAEPFAQRALSGVAAVELAGAYEPRELGALLDGADVGILPSVWEEVHGFVGIEMLAKGLPLIANAVGGIPEYVEEGRTGWLCHSAAGAELAELMAAALDDRDRVERLRRSVRDRRAAIVRPMSDHAAEVEELYAELTSGAGARDAATIASPAARRAES